MKRFFRQVRVGETTDGFAIFLDGWPIRTPAKKMLALPACALAEAVAEEWRGVPDEFDPAAMMLTKWANTALDRVAGNEAAVAQGLIANFSDLLCYRALAPEALSARQAAAWDPMLAWAADRFGARLKTGVGAAYIAQPAEALARIAAALAACDAFALTALAGTAAILGSLILALAVAEGRLSAAQAFALSRIDEIFQNERWGVDVQAQARADVIFAELGQLARVLLLSRQCL
jgi:chaperone required for assembly of F1-ATPase